MAKNKNRDEFTPATKRAIERQARGHCSNPACRRLTHAATSDGKGEINIGEAAHICAAAPGGPRYNPNMTTEERCSAENGIWLCDVHARAADAKDSKFTVEMLVNWKRQTNEDSWHSIMHNLAYGPGMQAPTPDELRDRLHAAAAADLEVFRQTNKWPSTTVALTLKVDHVDDTLSTRALANAVTTLDDLVLVAPPGMGKTTTLFQVAEGVSETGSGAPLVVPLGDWATEDDSLLHSILKRPAFHGVSEADFRAAAAKPGVVLLLDGWNELDAAARERARVQITALKAERPELGLVISTRKQALDIPFAGTRVDLLPLSDEQQMEIATAMRGEMGAQLVDQAWRTPGVRELVTIPLYLTALLSLPGGAPFPTTKEEVLRRFVAVHEQEARRAEALRTVAHGFQQDYLAGLAVFATTTANTAIADTNARRSISETARVLVAAGQITLNTQPETLLDVFVSNHVLMRSGDTPGYSFQHQLFQEWYASHHVERLIVEAASDEAARDKLKTDVLNARPWEEAVLFAVERIARGNAVQQEACGAAILAAYEVDPILAAEMIFRATDAVWRPIGTKVRDLVEKWHMPGKVDRALRFMITSGRPEFLNLVWPLITAENDQKSLPALRAARRFRPSVLGDDAARRIVALPSKVRQTVLHEIASNSGMDGLDLATFIAKADADAEVKATVVGALAFRRADRHVAEVLSTADSKTFDLVYRKGYLEGIKDKAVQDGLSAARERHKKEGVSAYDRLRTIIYSRDEKDESGEVIALLAEMDIDRKQNADASLIYEARKKYAGEVTEGLLQRVRNGRELFYGADDILATAGMSLEDDSLLRIALASDKRRDERAEAAASILGPKSVGAMIDALFEARGRARDASGQHDKAASNRHFDLRDRIAHTLGASLVAAVQARAESASNEEIAELAKLLSLRRDEDGERGRPFDTDARTAIANLAAQWSERLLKAGENADRSQLASVVDLIGHSPSVALLPTLRCLLDDELRRYKAFRVQAAAAGWRQGPALNEARTVYTTIYKQAFIAIRAPETTKTMIEYLPDEDFGESAATVLNVQWIEANEPKDDKRFLGSVDFSRVDDKRASRNADASASCAEADAIFAAVETLAVDGATENQVKHAVRLAIAAARLPHGDRAPIIQKLLSIAPQASRAALVQNLVLSGETVAFEMVKQGVADVLEDAKKHSWILSEGGWQLKAWLRLLPFADHPAGLPDVIKSLPKQQQEPRFLEEMISACESAPSEEIEGVLFKLAENDPRFYGDHAWRKAVLRQGTLSAARRFVDLVANGTLDTKEHWNVAR